MFIPSAHCEQHLSRILLAASASGCVQVIKRLYSLSVIYRQELQQDSCDYRKVVWRKPLWRDRENPTLKKAEKNLPLCKGGF